MIIKQAEFITSISDHRAIPKPYLPTFIIMGRSNVGKSSLINMLTQRKSLAKISSTPGKTRMINYFLINQSWYLVDLPGYGWARVSKTTRKKWTKNSKNYLLSAPNLVDTFLLIDSRHSPQDIDIQAMKQLYGTQTSFGIIFTKLDLTKKGEWANRLYTFQQTIQRMCTYLPPFFYTSSRQKQGRQEILSHIQNSLQSKMESKVN